MAECQLPKLNTGVRFPSPAPKNNHMWGDFMNAVIFDMDGLMFDTERLCMRAWDYAGEKMGVGKAGHMVMKTLGMKHTRAMEIWREEFGEAFDEPALDKYTKEFVTDFYAHNKVPVKKGLYSLLKYLKSAGFKIAVASSTTRDGVLRNLRSAEIESYFDVIISGDMVKNSKPAPDIYLKACEALGEAPENCYALEDSRSGTHSAARAGCKTVMVPDLWQPDEETVALLFKKCEDLYEVEELLKCL